ncbi:MAG TPA: hypothetical protein VLE96_00190 [Chlamydiales bacterium]|nr:hypothetical protein [Chlamydiales bacterium]
MKVDRNQLALNIQKLVREKETRPESTEFDEHKRKVILELNQWIDEQVTRFAGYSETEMDAEVMRELKLPPDSTLEKIQHTFNLFSGKH